MLATDMTSAGTAEEKLAWAFKVQPHVLNFIFISTLAVGPIPYH